MKRVPTVKEAAKKIIAIYNGDVTAPKTVLLSPEPVRAIAYHLGWSHKDGSKWWSDVMDEFDRLSDLSEGTAGSLYRSVKKPTKAEARALRIGDIVEAYYRDLETPDLQIVVDCCENNKSGDCWSIKTMRFADFGKRSNAYTGAMAMDTDKFRKVASAKDAQEFLAYLVACKKGKAADFKDEVVSITTSGPMMKKAAK